MTGRARLSGVPRVWAAAEGAALATLAGVLCRALGVMDVIGAGDPLGLTAAMGVAGFGLGFFGWARWLVAVDAVLLAFSAAVAYAGVMVGPATRWVRSDSLTAAPYDAVVVLSGGLTSDSTLTAEAADRLLTGIGVMQAGAAHRLITSRVHASSARRSPSSDADQRRLIALGGLEAAWSIVDSVQTTHDEALRTAQLLLPAGERRIVVVTAPMHTRRACATFEMAGFEVACVPAVERVANTAHGGSPDDKLAAFSDYLYERLGMWKYRLKGWVS